jgi:hypothetical protein
VQSLTSAPVAQGAGRTRARSTWFSPIRYTVNSDHRVAGSSLTGCRSSTGAGYAAIQQFKNHSVGCVKCPKSALKIQEDSGFATTGGRIIGASRPELWVGGAERVRRLDRRGVLRRSQPVPTAACVAPVASRLRVGRKRCFSEASLSQMSKESQRAWRQSQTPQARYASQSFAVLSALAVRIRATVGTELRLKDLTLMSKGGKELTRGRTPELGAVILARRQDPSAVRTKMNSPRRPNRLRLQERRASRTTLSGIILRLSV